MIIESPMFQKKMVEKSSGVGGFFCISAAPKPPSINVCERAINIANNPIHPKSLGVRRLANTKLAIKDNIIVPNR
jgi:hypothetical protein